MKAASKTKNVKNDISNIIFNAKFDIPNIIFNLCGINIYMNHDTEAFRRENHQGKSIMLNGEDYDTLALLENRSIANYRHLFDGVSLLAIDTRRNLESRSLYGSYPEVVMMDDFFYSVVNPENYLQYI